MKVLIYFSLSKLAPIGGPSGYLYGLKKALDNLHNEKITIDFLHENVSPTKNELKSIAKRNHKPIVKQAVKIYRSLRGARTLNMILTKQSSPKVNLNDYDVIHFHSTKDYYLLRDALKEYRGITILTSHSPQPLSSEFIQSLSLIEKAVIGKKVTSLIEMDRYTFRNVDFIVFPCESADEPYIHEWPEYQSIKETRKEKYRYLLTGSLPANIKTPRDVIREQYKIPKDAFVISYVGRHNEIKGYDRLKRIGDQFLKKHPNSYFIIAGREGPLKGIDHPRWIEVGWTDEPHSYINASDVFVLPNKETYFDLVLLEVLSIGTYSLISNTGGNKYFKKFIEAGLSFFDTEEDAINKLEKICNMSREEKVKKEYKNKKIFSTYFTTEIFAQNYLNLMVNLCKK